MNSNERRQARHERRRAKRKARRDKLAASIGTLEDVFCYHDMFKYGEKCCRGVMWKQSTQTFNRHLFSRTAVNRKNVLNGYKPKKLCHFTINERGKMRNIEAPHIDDRQVQKTLTQKVLLPLYIPRMIHDNGASLKGKGLHFSQNQLDKKLREHMKRYGMEGYIIIADFKGFFPNADRDIIKANHGEVRDTRLKNILDTVADSGAGTKGMPLGVEPSQLEMISFPSKVDSYISCQMGLDIGHYMDDYHILVPPDTDPKKILDTFVQKADELNITVNLDKTRIIPFGMSFKFCKCKRMFIGGRIIKRCCPKSIQRARRKIKAFRKLPMQGEDIYNSVNASLSHIANFNNHKAKLRLKRLFFALYGHSCENIEDFKEG